MILLEELADVEFLRGLAPEHVRRIAQAAQLEECLAGTVLFREGQRCPFVYLVLRGSVVLEVNAPVQEAVPVQTVEAGELLGWSPLFRLGPMTVTARTRTRCRLAVLDAARLLAMAEHDPRFGMELLRRTATVVARRLRAARLAGVENLREAVLHPETH
jgi:CRP/FNR family transcriptional regulator, cyclic AMP receptor protein